MYRMVRPWFGELLLSERSSEYTFKKAHAINEMEMTVHALVACCMFPRGYVVHIIFKIHNSLIIMGKG